VFVNVCVCVLFLCFFKCVWFVCVRLFVSCAFVFECVCLFVCASVCVGLKVILCVCGVYIYICGFSCL